MSPFVPEVIVVEPTTRPLLLPPQPEPVPLTTPVLLACRHWVPPLARLAAWRVPVQVLTVGGTVLSPARPVSRKTTFSPG